MHYPSVTHPTHHPKSSKPKKLNLIISTNWIHENNHEHEVIQDLLIIYVSFIGFFNIIFILSRLLRVYGPSSSLRRLSSLTTLASISGSVFHSIVDYISQPFFLSSCFFTCFSNTSLQKLWKLLV